MSGKPINRKASKVESYRTYRVNAPVELTPLYDQLQALEDKILSTRKYRTRLLKLDPRELRGNYWLALREIITPEVRKLNVKNRAWYSYNVLENIRQLHASLLDKQAAYEILKENDWKNDDAFQEAMSKAGIRLAHGAIRSLTRTKKKPELPTSDTFILDYSISSAQNFTIYPDDPLTAYIQRADGEWLAYTVSIPDWVLIKPGFTGILTKPRFHRDKNSGEFIGEISYGLDPVRTAMDSDSGAIMGVDLGKIKLFSSTVIYPDGSYSGEVIHSHLLELNRRKLDRLWAGRKYLEAAINRCLVENERQARRLVELDRVKTKIGNLRDSMAWGMAREIVSEASRLGARELHMEYLSWLDAIGGSWDHARVQERVREYCEATGISFIRVSAWNSSKQHPVTGEIGVLRNREVRFESGLVIDRDLLASLNLAQRSPKKKRHGCKTVKPVKVARVRDKHSSTPRRAKPARKTRRFPLVKQLTRNTFKINEGRGIIVASLPVQRTPRPSARDRWAARGAPPVSSNRSHRVTLSDSSES